MLVKDIMTVNVVTINQNQTLLELQGLMSDDNIRRVPVVNDAGMVVGKQVPFPVMKLPTC